MNFEFLTSDGTLYQVRTFTGNGPSEVVVREVESSHSVDMEPETQDE